MSGSTLRKPSATARRKSRAPPIDESTLVWADAHIHSRRHDTESLARAMRVSTARASRIVAQLRKKLAREGDKLVAVRDRSRHYFEIRDGERTLRRRQELVKMAGFIKGGPPILRPGETVDDVLYPKTGKCP